jgi:hypothetical protein
VARSDVDREDGIVGCDLVQRGDDPLRMDRSSHATYV